MRSADRSRPIPQVIRWAILLVIIGVVFPIYGTPPGLLGLPRVTAFRLGLMVLVFSAFSYHVSIFPVVIRKRFVGILCILLTFRLLSLINTYFSALLSTNPQTFLDGTRQIFWYSEGLLCLILILAYVERWPRIRQFFFSRVIFVCAISALFSTLQFIAYEFDVIVALPFSTTSFGVGSTFLGVGPSGPYGGWYPLAPGGRIMGSFFDPNMAGSLMVFFFCLLLPLIWFAPMKRSVMALVMMVPVSFGVLGSGSRQSMLIFWVVFCVFVLMIIGRRHWLLRPVYRISFTATVFIGILLVYRYLASNLNDFGLYLGGGDVLSRVLVGLQDTDRFIEFLGVRASSSMQMVSSYDYNVFFLGFGEGTGWWSSHNAFLIVLYENGLWALLALCFAGLLMLSRTFRNAGLTLRHRKRDPLAVAGPLIIISWALMLWLNWAQMNQSFTWVFLSLAMMPSEKMINPPR